MTSFEFYSSYSCQCNAILPTPRKSCITFNLSNVVRVERAGVNLSTIQLYYLLSSAGNVFFFFPIVEVVFRPASMLSCYPVLGSNLILFISFCLRGILSRPRITMTQAVAGGRRLPFCQEEKRNTKTYVVLCCSTGRAWR